MGTDLNDILCEIIGTGGTFFSLEEAFEDEGVNIPVNSHDFWAMKCRNDADAMTANPNIVQSALYNNNLTLIMSIISRQNNNGRGKAFNFNIILINENQQKETLLDWLDRQIAVAGSRSKTRLLGIRTKILASPFNAKTLNELR